MNFLNIKRLHNNTGCLICGSHNFKTVFNCTDTLTSHESFSIGECADCGFRFTMSPPSEENIGPYYLSDDYISHSDLKRGITERLYHLARTFMLRRKLCLIRSINGQKTGKILDIGCGTGYFPAFMKQNGWDASGIEISEKAREYAISKFGLEVISPDHSECLPGETYDCITLWHVMEHLYDPYRWFKTFDRLLKSDGVCIIALPNSESADAGWFKENWAAYDVPRHLWHFSFSSFARLSSQNGFSVMKIKTMPLDVFYISILSYKNMNASMPLLKGLSSAMVITLSALFQKRKVSSLIYILRKAKG